MLTHTQPRRASRCIKGQRLVLLAADDPGAAVNLEEDGRLRRRLRAAAKDVEPQRPAAPLGEREVLHHLDVAWADRDGRPALERRRLGADEAGAGPPGVDLPRGQPDEEERGRVPPPRGRCG